MKKFIGLIALALALLFSTACDPGRAPLPGFGGCNGGIGFVDQICVGMPSENGALTISSVVEDAGITEVRWELEYDEMRSEITQTVPINSLIMINTPMFIPDGDLWVRAIGFGVGTDVELFCDDDPEVMEDWTWAQIHLDQPQRLRMTTGNSGCWGKVDLDNTQGPGGWNVGPW